MADPSNSGTGRRGASWRTLRILLASCVVAGGSAVAVMATGAAAGAASASAAAGPPTLTTAASASVSVGNAVYDTATISGGESPSGTITFGLYGPSTSASCTTLVGTVTTSFTGDGTFTSPALTPPTPGTYYWTASVPAGASYGALSEPCGSPGESVVIGVTAPLPPPVTPPKAKFTVTSSDTPGDGAPVVPGAKIAYTLLVENAGMARGVAKVTAPLPASVTLTGPPMCETVPAGDACAVTATGTELTVEATLSPGDSAKVVYDAVVNATVSTTVTTTATITTGPCTSADCSATVSNPTVVLSVVKSSTPASGSAVTPSTTITYTLTLTDSGTAATTPVEITDDVPAGTTYVTGSATCGRTPGCTVSEATGTVTWTGIVVGPGAASSLAVSFRAVVITGDASGQKITNVAAFSNDGTPDCTSATCTTNPVTLVVVAHASKATHSPPPSSSPAPSGSAPSGPSSSKPPSTTSSSTTPPSTPATSATSSSSTPAPSTSPSATSSPVPSPPAKVSKATTSHTGEPWGGSGWLELAVLVFGLGLLASGEWLRRRHAKLTGRS